MSTDHLIGPAPEEWCLPVSSWEHWPGDLLVLIACSKDKAPKPAPAAKLYTGSLFVLALKAARNLVPDEQIRIVSARHGLVTLDRQLRPYDTRLNCNGDGAMPWILKEQAVEQRIAEHTEVLSLMPWDYWSRIHAVWPHAVDGFRGLKGIGYQRQECARIAAIEVGEYVP